MSEEKPESGDTDVRTMRAVEYGVRDLGGEIVTDPEWTSPVVVVNALHSHGYTGITHLDVLTRTTTRETFIKMRQLIGAGEQYSAWESPQPDSDNKYRRTMDPGFHMDLGQGLSALMWVDHWNGAMSAAHEHDKWCLRWDDNGPVEGSEYECSPDPRGYVEINYDTAYGYRADNNASCSDLHAWITQEIGA